MLAAALRTASGENLYIDTPSAFTAAPNACLPYLSAEELCFGMGMAPAEFQPALADEFGRRYLPDKLDQLDCIHRELDQAILDAYAWPHALTDDQILERLLALNLERSAP